MSSRVRRVGFALVVACGCGGRQSTPIADTATTSPPSAAVAATIGTNWKSTQWEPHAGVDPTDLGVGVVFLRRAQDKGATTGTDTLVLRSEPRVDATPVAAVLFAISDVGVTSYRVAAPDSLRSNLAEFGYEESGVPFDSMDASSRWARGIVGFARGDVVNSGWIDLQQPGVGTMRWTEQLVDRPIFFVKPEHASLFARPDSTTPLARLPRDDDAYAMQSLELRGPWMRVRIVTPSDNCVEPDSVPRETRTGWTRYLDARGRPNVWYYTRGC